jgi:hypothetical protein
MLGRSKSGLSTSAENAESLAVSALAFLAAEPERLERFLALTGLGPHNLRQAAAAPGFHASVLDYVVGDESLLLAFAQDTRMEPQRIVNMSEMLRHGREPRTF